MYRRRRAVQSAGPSSDFRARLGIAGCCLLGREEVEGEVEVKRVEWMRSLGPLSQKRLLRLPRGILSTLTIVDLHIDQGVRVRTRIVAMILESIISLAPDVMLRDDLCTMLLADCSARQPRDVRSVEISALGFERRAGE